MPIYEFKCKECEFIFSELIKLNEEYPKCPKCGGEVEKLISSPLGIEFKGDGFYETDYKNK